MLIKKADIIVGIPSFNEADNIAFVTDQVSRGLAKNYKNKKCVIFNIDGGSKDGTRDFFMRTQTEMPKQSLVVKGLSGKGAALRLLFQQSLKLRPQAIVIVDADLRSITPEWVRILADPILRGYDYVTPMYSRNQYDGTITNNITYPIIYGLLGVDMRQPMGGEFGFNARLVRHWLKQRWGKSTRQYGIDTFMSMNAILGKFKIAEVALGAKVHSPSLPKLGPMFSQVVRSTFHLLGDNKKGWLKKIARVRRVKVFGKTRPTHPPRVSLDIDSLNQVARDEYRFVRGQQIKYLAPATHIAIEQIFSQKKLHLPIDLWWKIIYDSIFAFDKLGAGQGAVDVLKPLYFTRVLSFINETKAFGAKRSENEIISQAKEFFHNRAYLLNRYQGF